jgi:hypothetical protein
VTVPPREVHEVQLRARAEQGTKAWQARYAIRAGAGAEGTIAELRRRGPVSREHPEHTLILIRPQKYMV